MERVNYLLDTNVLLEGLNDFLSTVENCGIIIPFIVLEELNNIKEKRDGEIAYKARRTMRDLFEIKKYGDLNNWVKLDNNVSIHVHHHFDDRLHLSYSCNDDIIIGCLSDSQKSFGNTVLVSADLNMLLKAEGFGLKTKNFKYEADSERFYSGQLEIEVEDFILNEFYNRSIMEWERVLESKPYQNQCVTIISKDNPKKQILTIFKNEYLEKLKYGEMEIFENIRGKNKEQKYLIELLMDDAISVVAVNSAAGTGKSFLCTAVALNKVMSNGSGYDKILYVKPLEAMGGKDIGYLKGEKNIKLLDGYSGTITNILENIFSERDKKYRNFSYAEDLIERGLLQVEAMTFMRGMSYNRTFLIIDEASNISKKDIKNILTRCGEGSKCCIIGDADQIDGNKLTVLDNGLQHVIEKLKGENIFGTIRLNKTVRSSVAQICVDKL